MTITTCDVCGKEMPTSTTTVPGNNFVISSHGRHWDICNDCREELNKWLKSRKDFQAKVIVNDTPLEGERKIGHWMYNKVGGCIKLHCSNCGCDLDAKYHLDVLHHYDYCPDCGERKE